MWEVIGAISGMLSLVLAIFLEWNRIHTRIDQINKSRARKQTQKAEATKSLRSNSKQEVIPMDLEEQKAAMEKPVYPYNDAKDSVSFFLTMFLVFAVVAIISYGLGIKSEGISGWIIAGIGLAGTVYVADLLDIQNRSWIFLLGYFGFGILLISVLGMLFLP